MEVNLTTVAHSHSEAPASEEFTFALAAAHLPDSIWEELYACADSILPQVSQGCVPNYEDYHDDGAESSGSQAGGSQISFDHSMVEDAAEAASLDYISESPDSPMTSPWEYLAELYNRSPSPGAPTGLVPPTEDQAFDYTQFIAGCLDDNPDSLTYTQPEAQGRSRVTDAREYTRHFRDLPPGCVYEFGVLVDLADQHQVADYLEHLAHWLRTLRKPGSAPDCRRIALSFVKGKPHRKICLLLLAKRGVPMAKLLLLSIRGTLPDSAFESFSLAEAQGISDTLGLAAAFAGAYLVYRTVKLEAKIQPIIEGAARVTSVADSAASAAESVIEWVKKAYAELKAKVAIIAGPVRSLIKGVLLTLTVIASGEYIRSVFPRLFGVLGHMVASTFSLLTPSWWSLTAQSGSFSDTFNEYCYTSVFGSRGCKAFLSSLNKGAGTFCKFVSVGRGIEWLFRNFRKWFSYAIEAWTGDAVPATTLEKDIELYREYVVLMESESVVMNMSDLSSADYAHKVQDLETFGVKVSNRILHPQSDVRPVFISIFNGARHSYEKMRERQRRAIASSAARPCPVWIYIHGGAGVGKSTIADPLAEAIYNKLSDQKVARCPGRFQPYDRYGYNTADSYHDSYAKQFVISMDDFLSEKDPADRAAMAKFMLNLVSCTPYALLSATPETKGALWVDSPLIITTSNLAPKNEFKGENLGLTDASAFADRRAISVRMVRPVLDPEDRDGKHTFILDPGRQLDFGQGPRSGLSFVELASLAASIIRERLETPPMTVSDLKVPDFCGHYTAPRGVTIDRFYDVPLDDPDCDGKGKEKLIEGDYLDESSVPIEANGSIRDTWNYYSHCLLDNEAKALNSLPDWIKSRIKKVVPSRFYLQPLPGEDHVEWAHRVGFVPNLEEGPTTLDLMDEVKGLVPLSASIPVIVTTIAVAALLIWEFVRALLPSSASEPIEGHSEGDFYRSAPNRRQPKKLTRATARSQRWKQLHGPKANSLPKDGGPFAHGLVDAISRNSQIISSYHTTLGREEIELQGIRPDSTSWCLFIAGNVALVPGHTLLASDDPVDDPLICIDCSVKYWVRLSEIERFEEVRGDVFLVEFPNYMNVPSILHHFARSYDQDAIVHHILPAENTLVAVRDKVSRHQRITPEVVSIPGYDPFEVDVRFVGVKALPGMCGTAYVNGNDQIIAIHMAGRSSLNIGYGVMILHDDVAHFCRRIFEPPLTSLLAGQRMTGASVVGYLPSNRASYLPDVSAITPTDYDMSDFPFPATDHLPAKLKAERVDGVLHSPVANALRKLQKSVVLPAPPTMTDFGDFVPDTFDPSFNRLCSIEDAIYGNTVLKPMDRHNSVGYRFKKLGFTREALFGDPDSRTPHPLLRRAVEQIIEKWRDGCVVPTVYEFFLKDELRPKAKVDSFSTRPISPDCLENLVALRMVFGYLSENLMSDPTGCPVALAINPHSFQWTQLWQRLGSGSRRPIAGDFETYDFTIGNCLVSEFLNFCEWAMPLVPPSMIEAALLSAFNGWHVCGRMVFQRLCGTSSGSFLTAIFNTFVNWWIHKSSFKALYPDGDFRSIGFSAVGDDSVGGVPPEYPDYTMDYVGVWARKNLGMTYTNCSKNGTGHLSWAEVTFLKRSFVPESGRVLAPLAGGSIYNAVAWSSSDYRSIEVAQSVSDSVLLESYHHGQRRYEEVLSWYKRESGRLGRSLRLRNYRMLHADRLKEYYPQ